MSRISYFPPTYVVWPSELPNSNARNWLYKIWIKDGIECPAAVAAQERYEFFAKWKLIIPLMVIGAVVGYLVSTWLGLFGGLFLGFVAGALIGRIPFVVRAREYMGHAIECVVASRPKWYNRPYDQYVVTEAASMTRGYNGLFKGINVVSKLNKNKTSASEWVDSHTKIIDYYYRTLRGK